MCYNYGVLSINSFHTHMDQNTNVEMSGKVCKCSHHKVMPIALILIGLIVLLGNLGWLGANGATIVGIVWPILLIIAAGTKLGGCKCCAK